MPIRGSDKETKNGFTIIEIMVSIGIIGLLAILVFSNFRSGNNAQNLTATENELFERTRLVQNYALTGRSTLVCAAGSRKNFSCATSVDCAGDACQESIPEYFGISYTYPQGKSAIIFADRKDKNGDDGADKKYSEGYDEIIETLTLKNNITLESCETPAQQTCANPDQCTCNIVFQSGDGHIFTQAQEYLSALIKIMNTASGKEQYIQINGKSGSIERP